MPVIPKEVCREGVTLIDLWNDPRKMAAFMGWSFEADEVEEYAGNWSHTYRTKTLRKRTATEATMERLDNWLRYQRANRAANQRDRTHLNYIQECARESIGITGRTQAEIIRKCIAARPDLFSLDGNFKEMQCL